MDDPTRATNESRIEVLAPWIVGFAFTLPVLLAKYPPMTDLPLHEAIVGILRHWGDPNYSIPGLYRLNFGHPNQLFYFLAWVPSLVMPTDWACKLVVAATLVAIPVSASRFAAHLGVPRWTALLVAPLGLGWLFFWGLLANMIGLAALLFMLPVLDRYSEKPSWRGVGVTALAMLFLYSAHEAMMVTACLAVVIFALTRPWAGLSTLVARGVPAATAFLIALAHLVYQQTMMPATLKAFGRVVYSVKYKLLTIPGVLFAGFEENIRNLMFLIAMIPVILFAIKRWQTRSRDDHTWRERAFAWRYELVALVLFILYLTLPMTLNGATLVHHRFLPPAYALFVLAMAPRAVTHLRLLPKLASAMVPVGSLLLAWPVFFDSHRVYTDLNKVMAKIEPGEALIALELGPAVGLNRLWAPVAAEGYVVAHRGGRSRFDYTQSPISPAMQLDSAQWTEIVLRIGINAYNFRPQHDLRRFRYVLLHTWKPDFAGPVIASMQPEAHLVDSQGEWYLLESDLERLPITTPDVPLPNPRPETLRKRLKDLFQQFKDANDPRADHVETVQPGPDELPFMP